MNLKKIHHVAIIASDYKKSKDFYVNLLGLKIIREVYREERDSYKLDLEIGDSQIELFSFKNPPKRPSYPEACGLRHLAFEVKNIEEQVRE
ncbi:SMU1112c/YaeR family gloxylase I-like metalloprotein, partial [Clostridium perfringens]